MIKKHLTLQLHSVYGGRSLWVLRRDSLKESNPTIFPPSPVSYVSDYKYFHNTAVEVTVCHSVNVCVYIQMLVCVILMVCWELYWRLSRHLGTRMCGAGASVCTCWSVCEWSNFHQLLLIKVIPGGPPSPLPLSVPYLPESHRETLQALAALKFVLCNRWRWWRQIHCVSTILTAFFGCCLASWITTKGVKKCKVRTKQTSLYNHTTAVVSGILGTLWYAIIIDNDNNTDRFINYQMQP